MLRAFKKVNSDDRTVSILQDNISLVFNQLALCDLLTGVRLLNVTVTNAADGTIINHGLLREPLGYLIIDKQAAGDVWRVAWTPRTLTLKASVSSVNISLWVF